jgi:predicted lipoprotein with Yx(FWY)xxD motif
LAVAVLPGAAAQIRADDASPVRVESYIEEPLPDGFRVEATELEGPVFADAEGRTLYTWPSKRLRNGYSGETPGKPGCYDEVLTVTAGLMSPYPPGVLLPDLDTRPSCTDLWPPVLAPDDAEPVGNWSTVVRTDGSLQWAHDEHPVYTSVLDSRPGDTYGGSNRRTDGDSPAVRKPVGPDPDVPPGFAVATTTIGRLLTTDKTYSVYAYDRDTPDTSACDEQCARTWKPVLAPALARPLGEWSIIERSPGVRQWAFRQQPLYTHVLDQQAWSQEGSDVPGWSNVYTQLAPPPPASFTAQDTLIGRVLADRHGMTVYTYVCGDDAADQLSCEHPRDTQVYRLAMCGGGDAERCQQHWPYVRAQDSEESSSRAWRIITVNPATGRLAADGEAGALRVWAYRDRPVYTYGGDEEPGDLNGAGTGEWRGLRNGLKAFWLRDDYLRGTL